MEFTFYPKEFIYFLSWSKTDGKDRYFLERFKR